MASNRSSLYMILDMRFLNISFGMRPLLCTSVFRHIHLSRRQRGRSRTPNSFQIISQFTLFRPRAPNTQKQKCHRPVRLGLYDPAPKKIKRKKKRNLTISKKTRAVGTVRPSPRSLYFDKPITYWCGSQSRAVQALPARRLRSVITV